MTVGTGPTAVTTTYTWDQESRITAIAKPGVVNNTFKYNGLDTRVEKVDAGGTLKYRRDGAYVTDPVLEDKDGNGTSQGKYTPGISESRAGTSRWLHSGIKNADGRTLANKTLEATREYDAFGNIVASTGEWKGQFGYAGGFGYQEDPDHGLKLLGHRYYDSTTGRFLSRDPAEDGRNWYSYCANNPARSFDSRGLQRKECWEGTDHVNIAGDTSGDARWAWLLYGPSLNNVSKSDVIEVLITTHGSVRIWGHGASGRIWINYGGDWAILTPIEMRIAALLRAMLGNHKLKDLYIDQCCVMSDPKMINACLELADEVHGYEGWTINPDRGNARGKNRSWTSPVPEGVVAPDNDDNYKQKVKRRKPMASRQTSQGPSVAPVMGGGSGGANYRYLP